MISGRLYRIVAACAFHVALVAVGQPQSGVPGRLTKAWIDSTAMDESGFGIVAADLRATINDGSSLLQGVMNLSASDALSVGAVAGGVAVLFAQDEAIQERITAQGWNGAGGVFAVGQLYGDVRIAGALGGGIWMCGIVTGDRSLRELGRLTLSAVLYAGLITTAVKSLSGRSRPYVGEGPRMFRPLQFDTEHTSFPSGHSTVAFAVSSVLSSRIDHPVATIVLYSLASLTAAQRMVASKHWASDVFLGAAVGYGIGTAVVKISQQRESEQTTGVNMTFAPVLTARGTGLALYVRW